MDSIAIVPARAGSKSITNKNLIKLNSRETLVEMAINTAHSTGLFSNIYLTTDIPLYLENGVENAKVHKRCPGLCSDNALMDNVIRDVVSVYRVNPNAWVWLLQPTSPFRSKKHFFEINKIISSKDSPKSVVSVQSVGAFHPNRMYTKKRDYIFRLRNTSFLNKQDLPDVYIRNGAFYVIRVKDFLGKWGLHTRPCHGYVMSDTESINIDSPFDLGLAKYIQANK